MTAPAAFRPQNRAAADAPGVSGLVALAAPLLLAGCASMAPPYAAPALPVTAHYPGDAVADPRESMPLWVQYVMSLAPTTHFTELSQAILYRGAGLAVVWTSFAALLVIGSVLFTLSLAHFRKMLSQMA
jgi:ABC-type multidrug transport system permease subunit